MNAATLIDIGSTFTKVALIDTDEEQVIGTAQAPTTVRTDVNLGLKRAFADLKTKTLVDPGDSAVKLACSSAAGGLRMVVIGLVPALTAQAANLAALGAGAKIVRTFSYFLGKEEAKILRSISPDIILLAGGTDGGNTEVLLHNAKVLARLRLSCPIVVAGNAEAADQVREIFSATQTSEIHVVENVMPEFGRINIEPSRAAIRDIFVRTIIRAKGIDSVRESIDDVIMPTPLAVLTATNLLASGSRKEEGLGDTVVVEVGGATTNVHSASRNEQLDDAIVKGIEEPFAKRTVEGDLGVRYNALRILELAGSDKVKSNVSIFSRGIETSTIAKRIRKISKDTTKLPCTPAELAIDSGLARTTVEIAMERHAGTIIYSRTSDGERVQVLHGKNLTNVKYFVGVGGVIIHSKQPKSILEAGFFSRHAPHSLRPRNPILLIDSKYVFYAAGLLSKKSPEKALRILKTALSKVS